MIVFSLLDLIDDKIISIFSLQSGVTFELILDFIGPILTVSLMFWTFLTGKKVISLIRVEEEQYKRLVELSPEAIIIHKKGKILFINKSGARLFGTSSTSELINRNISEFLDQDSRTLFKEHLDKSPTREFHQQVEIKRIDGAIICLEFKSTNIEFKGQSVSELIARDVSILKKEMENVKQLAYQDVLTGLPNRRAFMERLILLLKSSETNRTSFGVMFIDLDGFKQVNDTLGHEGGDILLKQVSDYFKECVPQKGIVARLAGDEFVILLDQANSEECKTIAKKIIERLSSSITILGKKVRVTSSIGIAIYPQNGNDATELVNNADKAMYHAKQQGKNNYYLYEPLHNY